MEALSAAGKDSEMQKLVAAIALALAALALVACGSSGGGSTETSSEEAGGQTTPAPAEEETEGESGQSGGAAAEGGTAGGGSTVSFETPSGGELAYTSSSASAKAGKVTIDFNNPQPLGHDVAF